MHGTICVKSNADGLWTNATKFLFDLYKKAFVIYPNQNKISFVIQLRLRRKPYKPTARKLLDPNPGQDTMS
jgi:hypothetical protein